MNRNLKQEPAVYGLRASGVFGYVGGTLVNTRTRMWEHRSRARQGHQAPVYEWMREVGIANVEAVVLERMPTTNLLRLMAAEARWIEAMLRDGEPLRNAIATDGVPHAHTEVSRRRISQAKRGGSTWIKGKTGEAAGWTAERRAAQSERIRAVAERRRQERSSPPE